MDETALWIGYGAVFELLDACYYVFVHGGRVECVAADHECSDWNGWVSSLPLEIQSLLSKISRSTYSLKFRKIQQAARDCLNC